MFAHWYLFVCVCVHEHLRASYLVLLLLLFAKVAAVGVVFDNFLAHVIHSVHQKLKALLQVVAGRQKKVGLSFTHILLFHQSRGFIHRMSHLLNTALDTEGYSYVTTVSFWMERLWREVLLCKKKKLEMFTPHCWIDRVWDVHEVEKRGENSSTGDCKKNMK